MTINQKNQIKEEILNLKNVFDVEAVEIYEVKKEDREFEDDGTLFIVRDNIMFMIELSIEIDDKNFNKIFNKVKKESIKIVNSILK